MIRHAEFTTDFPGIRALNDECYTTDEVTDTEFQRVLRNPAWVSVDRGRIAASLMSEIAKDQPYIWSVATAPSHRGQGLATALIKEFETHYKTVGYTRPWLHVRVENPAQKLYFDLGYRVASFEPNIYGMHEHGLTMRKQLV